MADRKEGDAANAKIDAEERARAVTLGFTSAGFAPTKTERRRDVGLLVLLTSPPDTGNFRTVKSTRRFSVPSST
jgi:hypothetical protein